jgi:MATE family multidrug resistance protein
VSGFAADSRRILALAWPVLIGQLSVVAFATVDTFLLGRHSAVDLAALAVGGAAYMTIFIALMGVVLAVGPIAGQLFGAGRLAEAGAQLHQGVWLALVVSVPGCLLMLFPWPFLLLADSGPEVEPKARAYLAVLSLAVAPSLLFTAFRSFNTAVSRPKAVMLLQLAGLSAKVPLSIVLVQGHAGLGIPALGVVGCAIGSLIAFWLQALLAWQLLRRDPFYDRFALRGRGLHRPDRRALKALLQLGLPIGGSLLVEISGFTLMAIFIARMGTTPVAGHQIAINLVSLLFMVPLALAQASSALVAQHVGAAELPLARRVGWHGVELGLLIACVLVGVVYLLREPLIGLYTRDAAVAAVALSLLAWMGLFHIADAAQAIASFVLRAWKIATVPMLIYVASLWGVGLGGGTLLGFDVLGGTPPALRGAPGYWVAATAGLVISGVAMCSLLAWVLNRQQRPTPSVTPAA